MNSPQGQGGPGFGAGLCEEGSPVWLSLNLRAPLQLQVTPEQNWAQVVLESWLVLEHTGLNLCLDLGKSTQYLFDR